MGVMPDDPLQAGSADIISWNNRTGDFHQPSARTANGYPDEDAKAQGLYLSDLSQPGASSRPGYVTNASAEGVITIDYTCFFHPEEGRYYDDLNAFYGKDWTRRQPGDRHSASTSVRTSSAAAVSGR